jgi:hypothetical protein
LAQLEIPWGDVTTLTQSVVSGSTAITPKQAVDKDGVAFDWQKPTLVWVYADDLKAGEFNDVTENVLIAEKICLGVKAFKTVKMSPAAADADALVSNNGTSVPRFVLIDHNSSTVEVVEDNKRARSKITQATLYTAMTKISKLAYMEKIDTQVKENIKLLNEIDKLSGALKTLNDKLERYEASDRDRHKEEIPVIKADIAANLAATQALIAKQNELWCMTPRKPKSL